MKRERLTALAGTSTAVAVLRISVRHGDGHRLRGGIGSDAGDERGREGQDESREAHC